MAVGVQQSLVKAYAVGRRRSPAGLFGKTCLCARLLLPFPVVQAWSVWNKKDGSADHDPAMEKFAKTIRLTNTTLTTSDRKALVEVLYRADYLYKHGESSDHTEIFDMLSQNKVRETYYLLRFCLTLLFMNIKQAKTLRYKSNELLEHQKCCRILNVLCAQLEYHFF